MEDMSVANSGAFKIWYEICLIFKNNFVKSSEILNIFILHHEIKHVTNRMFIVQVWYCKAYEHLSIKLTYVTKVTMYFNLKMCALCVQSTIEKYTECLMFAANGVNVIICSIRAQFYYFFLNLQEGSTRLVKIFDYRFSIDLQL